MNLLKIKLERKLTKINDEFQGVMGLAVKDLETGDEFTMHGDEVFPIASSIKIPILIEFFKRVEIGEIDPKSHLNLLESHKVGGSGVLKELGSGTLTMSLLDYAILMITVSDNSATNIIIDLVGIDNVNHTLSQLGLVNTKFERKMMNLEGLKSGKENVSTPQEMLTLMESLHLNRGLSPWVCERTVEILKKPKEGMIEGVIRNAVPEDVKIADKSGWVEGATCDVGIVFLPKRPYLVSIMTKHIPVADQKRLAAIEAMTKVTKLVYEYFSEMSLSTPYGRR